MEKNMERMSPIMESLASRYGVKDATDYDGIMKAMEEDDGFFEDAAAAEGLTVEQYAEAGTGKRSCKGSQTAAGTPAAARPGLG